jgi:hypothetical protein
MARNQDLSIEESFFFGYLWLLLLKFRGLKMEGAQELLFSIFIAVIILVWIELQPH